MTDGFKRAWLLQRPARFTAGTQQLQLWPAGSGRQSCAGAGSLSPITSHGRDDVTS